MSNHNPNASDPGHQHTSNPQKVAKEDWNKLVKMTELHLEFRKTFRDWCTDKTKSEQVVKLGEELMQLQKSTGKDGGGLSFMQVMHRTEEAKDCIRKGLDQLVAKRDPNSSKLIRKTAEGHSVWVLK